jgi:hypothetical protein
MEEHVTVARRADDRIEISRYAWCSTARRSKLMMTPEATS